MATQRRVIKAIARHLALLQAELSELEGDIDGAIRNSPAWRADADLLKSVPGVGPATLRTLIAELPELGTLSAAKSPPWSESRRSTATAAHCAGAAPSPAAAPPCAPPSSWPPWSPAAGTRHRAHYDKLRAAGKTGKQALTACIRKLIVILNAILRDRKPWQPA